MSIFSKFRRGGEPPAEPPAAEPPTADHRLPGSPLRERDRRPASEAQPPPQQPPPQPAPQPPPQHAAPPEPVRAPEPARPREPARPPAAAQPTRAPSDPGVRTPQPIPRAEAPPRTTAHAAAASRSMAKPAPSPSTSGVRPAAKPAPDKPPPRGPMESEDTLVTRIPVEVEQVAVDTFAELQLQAEVDARFSEITASRPPPPAASPTPSEHARAAQADAEAVRATFLAIAASYLRQVRDAMLELSYGDAPGIALAPAARAVKVVEDAARKVGDQPFVEKLAALRERLARAHHAMSDTARDAILEAYGALVPLAPQQLGLDGERDRREAVIVRALLTQVPSIEKLALEKLFAAGLGRLSNLLRARADEIDATTGLGAERAAQVAETLAKYMKEFGTTAAALDRNRERTRLVALLDALRDEHRAFERAAEQWTDASQTEKNRRREARRRVLLQIDVVLARLGEIDRISTLERLPVQRRIEQLDAFVTDEAVFGAAPA